MRFWFPALLVFAPLLAAANGAQTMLQPLPLSGRSVSGSTSAWSATSYPDGSAPRGKLLFERFCLECHGPVPPPPPPGAPPPPGPPMVGPPGTAEIAHKYQGQIPGELEKRSDLDAATIIAITRSGIGVMPPVRTTDIDDADLRALALYLSHGK